MPTDDLLCLANARSDELSVILVDVKAVCAGDGVVMLHQGHNPSELLRGWSIRCCTQHHLKLPGGTQKVGGNSAVQLRRRSRGEVSCRNITAQRACRFTSALQPSSDSGWAPVQ